MSLTLSTGEEDDRLQRAHLATANRILSNQGVLDAFGHVSMRVPNDPGRFLLSRNLAPALVNESDIQTYDLNGETADSRPSYLERFIHAEIYRARPDVMAVVHSHSPTVVPFSVSKVPLSPVMHTAGFIPQSTPVFEARETLGNGSDLLIRDRTSGLALASTLGEGAVALMRGHGSVAVGESLKIAVYRAVYTEVNAKAQAEAIRLGSYTSLTIEECAAANVTTASQIDRTWTLWSADAASTSYPQN